MLPIVLSVLWLSVAHGESTPMTCDPENAEVLSQGALSEREHAQNWKIVRCAGEKPSLWVTRNNETIHIYTAKKSKLASLGFIDGASPARKLDEVGTTWRISQGTHGHERSLWMLREGKHTHVFIDVAAGRFRVLGQATASCNRQIDIDPSPDGLTITTRKANHGDPISTLVIEFDDP